MIKRLLAVFLTISLIFCVLPIISVQADVLASECELINLNVENCVKGSEGKTVGISWKNPTAPIECISVYDITGEDEILLTNSLSLTPSAYVCYYIENLINGQVYSFKVSVLFENGIKREYFVSAAPAAGTNESLLSDGKWSFNYARYDSQSFYPAVFYSVVNDDIYDGGFAIKIVSNTDKKKSGNYSILKCAFPSLEVGVEYTVKIRYKASGTASPEIKLNNSKTLGAFDMNTLSFSQKEFSFVQGEDVSAEYISILTSEGFDEVIIDSISLYEKNGDTDIMSEYGSLSGLTDEDNLISDFKDLSYGNMANISYNQAENTRGSRIYLINEDGEYVLRSVIKRWGAQKIEAKAFGLLENCENNIKITTVNKDYKETDGEIYTVFTNSATEIETKLNDLKTKLNELNTLMEECNKKGLSVDYEKVNCATIEKFIEIMREDFYKYNEFERANGYYDKLIRLYEESYSNMQKYLDGSLIPKSVPEFINNEIIIDGNNVVSKMEKDNIIEKSNIFLNGYGHFTYPLNDYEVFNDFGANSTSLGIKFYDVVTQKNPAKSWNLYEYGSLDNYTVERSSEEKASGDYSLKYTRADVWATKKSFYVRQTVDVKPKTTYVFGLWAKGVNAKNCHFSAHTVIDSNYGLSQRTRYDLSGTYDWTNFEFTYTTKENEYLLEILIPCSEETEALYIDDVYVKRINTDENLILNPGFEEQELSDSEFSVYDGHIKKLIYDLNYAYENRLGVNVGLGIHYMPEYIFADYPDLKDADGAYPSYMGFNPTHPKIKEMITVFLDAVIPEIKNHPALISVCIANEPNFQCFNTSYYEVKWQEHLKNMYSDDIEAFNDKCNTDYADFSEIKFSDAQDFTPLKYHLYRYNDTIMTEYLTYIANGVKNLAPEIKIFAKNLPAIRAHGKKSLAHGIDLESLTGIFDVNGCDAMHYIDHSEYPLLAKMEWYDLLTSIEDLPVFNTEDHLIRDSSSFDAGDNIVNTSYADIWQGAVHGRRQSVIWLWDREETRLESSYLNANMLIRPDIVANNGKLFLDMQRLSNELYALANAKREVAILYSYNSMTYEPSYLNSVYLAYINTLYLGQKPVFVAESQIEKLLDCKVLIVPEAISVFDKTYEKISEFINGGGKVVVIGENSLTKNEFLKERNIDDIKENLVVIPTYEPESSEITQAENLFDILKNSFDEKGILNVRLYNQSDNEPATDVEYTVANLNGNTIINLCNYSDEVKNVYILDSGETVEALTELISGKTIEKVVVLEPYKPVMVRYSYNIPSLAIDKISNDETVISTSLSRIESGTYKVSASLDKEGILYVAMYKDKKLCRVMKYPVGKGFGTNFYISLNDEYDLMKAMLWYEDNLLMPAMENIELLSKEASIINNVKYIDDVCYIFGNVPEVESEVSFTVYSSDGQLVYIDQINSDHKGNFKFAMELSDKDAGYTAKVKLNSGKTVTFLIN